MKLALWFFLTLPLLAHASTDQFENHLLKSFGAKPIGNIVCENILRDFARDEAMMTDEERETMQGCFWSDVQPNLPNMLQAYSHGFYPLRVEAGMTVWCNPVQRGILYLDQVVIRRSNRKALNRLSNLVVTKNQDPAGVLDGCARRTHVVDGRRISKSTWISPAIKQSFLKMKENGNAFSVEVHDPANGRLVGGAWITNVNGVWTGESVFNDPDYPNAGKLALLQVIKDAKAAGMKFIDIEMVPGETDLLAQFGGTGIKREIYLEEELPAAQMQMAASIAPQTL